MKVCILSAGKGTRMGDHTLYTNKSLLPYKKKAIISHIIDSFPSHYEFVIAIGYKGNHVRQYLEMAHPGTRFHFVTVDNFENAGSGPGYSLLCCKELLQEPFYMVCGDTLWDPNQDQLNAERYDWLGVSQVPDKIKGSFCTLEISSDENKEVKQIFDKDKNSPSSIAFTGLFYIYNYNVFFKSLKKGQIISGEHQISNGFSGLMENKSLKSKTMKTWLDLGDSEKYIQSNQDCPDFAFRKYNEHFYQVDQRIIKFFADYEMAEQRVQRQRLLAHLTPEITNSSKNFYCYERVKGEVLYDHLSIDLFEQLLFWLDKNLWISPSEKPLQFDQNCYDFYKEKTERRLQHYFKRFPDPALQASTMKTINSLDWGEICAGRPVLFHGDLQFDNIIYHQGQFRLIDWRQSFSRSLKWGDIHYDLAKLKLGIDLHLKKLKMLPQERLLAPDFTFSPMDQSQKYNDALKDFCDTKGISFSKVKTITQLAFINMAPLHSDRLAPHLFERGLKGLQCTNNGFSHPAVPIS